MHRAFFVCRACFLLVLSAAFTAACSEQRSNDEHVATIQTLQLSEAGTPSSSRPPSMDRCVQWCNPDNPDFRCFLIAGLEGDRETQLQELIRRLAQPAPIEITHSDLLMIFEIKDSSAQNLRQSTFVQDDTLTNAGRRSIMSAKTLAELTVSVLSPEQISYDFSKSTDSIFTLTRQASDNVFDIHLDDEVLDSTYGGEVDSIRVEQTRIILAADNGCISLDTTDESPARLFAAIAEQRLAAENAAGADTSRIARVTAAYLKLATLNGKECDIYGEDCKECPEGKIPCKIGHKNQCMTPEECDLNGGEPC